MSSLITLFASGVLLGSFTHRLAAGVLSERIPDILEPVWLGASVVVCLALLGALWFLRRLAEPDHLRRPMLQRSSPLWCFGFVPLLATLFHSYLDVTWNVGLLLIAVLSVLSISYGAKGLVWLFFNHWKRLVVMGREGRPWLLIVAVTIPSMVAYWNTLAPSVVVGDSSEMQVVTYTLGIAHPTGYPLYILLGKLFTLLPFGNVAFRVNLMSAVLAAVAAGILTLAVYHVSRSAVAAIVAGLSLAFSRILWSQAVIAEVYALHVLIVVAILALLSVFVMTGDQQAHNVVESEKMGRRRHRDVRLWILACLLFGLGLAHHRMTVLLAPAIVVAWLFGGRRFMLNLKVVGGSVISALLPLSLYSYLVLRWPDANGSAVTAEQLWWHVTGSGYGAALRYDLLVATLDRYQMFARLSIEQFTYIGLTFVFVGILWSAVKQRRVFLISGCVFVCSMFFGLAYDVPDVEVFFLPCFVVMALWLGFGVAGCIECGTALFRRVQCNIVTGFSFLALLLPLVLFSGNWAAVDRSAEWDAHEWGQRVLKSSIEDGALVLADVDKLSPLRYFFGVEAADKHVTSVMPDTEEQCYAILADRVGAGRPTYLSRFLPGIGKRYSLSSVGALAEVFPKGSASRKSIVSVGKTVAWEPYPGLSLGTWDGGEGWEHVGNVDSRHFERGDCVGFTLYWSTDRRLDVDAKVRISLLSETGKVWFSSGWRDPVNGLYPTSQWEIGEVVSDYWELTIPKDISSQAFDMVVEVSSPGAVPRSRSLAKVIVDDGLAGSTSSMLSDSSHVFINKELEITRTSIDSPVSAGGTAKLSIRWSVAKAVTDDYYLHWLLVDRVGTVAAEGRTEVFEGEWPTSRWTKGASYVTTLPLVLPRSLAEGSYELRIEVMTRNGHPANLLSDWPGNHTNYLSVGRIDVLDSRLPLTNIDNKAILLRCQIRQQSLRQGETLMVSLEWQCVSLMNHDYTVFLHLLDSEKHVQAQIDRYPVNGTRPTSQWKQGEVVVDNYELVLPQNLPAGNYEVEVGLYLGATMERLPIVDAGLSPIDDRIILGNVTVTQ